MHLTQASEYYYFIGHPTNSWTFPSPTDMNMTPVGSLGTNLENSVDQANQSYHIYLPKFCPPPRLSCLLSPGPVLFPIFLFLFERNRTDFKAKQISSLQEGNKKLIKSLLQGKRQSSFKKQAMISLQGMAYVKFIF